MGCAARSWAVKRHFVFGATSRRVSDTMPRVRECGEGARHSAVNLDARLLRFRNPIRVRARRRLAGTSSTRAAPRRRSRSSRRGLADDARRRASARPGGPGWCVEGDRAGAGGARRGRARTHPTNKQAFRWLGEVLLKRGDPARAEGARARARARPEDRGCRQLPGARSACRGSRAGGSAKGSRRASGARALTPDDVEPRRRGPSDRGGPGRRAGSRRAARRGRGHQRQRPQTAAPVPRPFRTKQADDRGPRASASTPEPGRRPSAPTRSGTRRPTRFRRGRRPRRCSRRPAAAGLRRRRRGARPTRRPPHAHARPRSQLPASRPGRRRRAPTTRRARPRTAPRRPRPSHIDLADRSTTTATAA